MNRRRIACTLALALSLCLALTGIPGLSERDAARMDPVESAIPEEAEFVLAAEAGESAGEEAIPSETVPEAETAEDAARQGQPESENPVEQSEEKIPSGPVEMRFSETLFVNSDIWEDVNIVRDNGFKGKYATVDGQLTLKNVLFNGKPARAINLSKAFTLGETGRIAIIDDADLSLEASALSINKGDSTKLAVKWKGKTLKARKARWKTSNSAVAKVSSSGKISAKKKGKATITVSYKGRTVKCRVIVTNTIRAESVSINPARLTLSLNGTATLKAQVKPKNATDKSVIWSSSKPSTVSVNEEGTLTALAVGSATIKATTANGKSATCQVTVKEVKLKSFEFARLYVTLNPGDTRTLKINFQPEDASYRALRFSSDDSDVVSVDKSTGEVTANRCGTATITARSEYDDRIRSTCKVCVIDPEAKRMAGLIIGINPGHQIKTVTKLYPLAPGSHKKAKGVKTGACGKYTRVNEYETVLQIGLKLADMLREEGATVVITRTSNDVNLTNIDRAKMLNDAGVDVALQLHCDSSNDRSKHGCRGYIRSTGDWVRVSQGLAKALTRAISANTGCTNNGVKFYDEYMSLNWTTTPSVLLEMGFISNKKEDELLASDAYREQMARGILEGLCDFYGR